MDGNEQVKVEDWDLTDGRDELNLAEFPLSCLGKDPPRGVKTLVFEDEIFDSSRRRMVSRKLTVAGSDDLGLPTALDEDVLVSLIKFTKDSNGFSEPRVAFSRYRLLDLLGWDHGGKSYRRLDESLHRWAGVTLRYKRAWWDKKGQRWKDQSFHVLDLVELYGRGDSEEEQIPLPLSSFTWNSVLFSSFQAGYIKQLNLEVYNRLRLSGSRRAYRFLGKRFYHRSRWEFPLREFACVRLGASVSHDNGNLKRCLRPIIAELVDVGFLEPLSEKEQFVRVGHGEWEVVFQEAATPEKAPKKTETIERSNDTLEDELVRRGVTSVVAGELVADSTFGEQRIREKLELHDWLLQRKDKRIAGNPAGYLVTAIREDYALPKGFKTKSQREAESRARAEREAAKRAEAQREAAEREEERRRNRELQKVWDTLPAEEQDSIREQVFAENPILVPHFRRNRESILVQSACLQELERRDSIQTASR